MVCVRLSTAPQSHRLDENSSGSFGVMPEPRTLNCHSSKNCDTCPLWWRSKGLLLVLADHSWLKLPGWGWPAPFWGNCPNAQNGVFIERYWKPQKSVCYQWKVIEGHHSTEGWQPKEEAVEKQKYWHQHTHTIMKKATIYTVYILYICCKI